MGVMQGEGGEMRGKSFVAEMCLHAPHTFAAVAAQGAFVWSARRSWRELRSKLTELCLRQNQARVAFYADIRILR